MSAPPTAALPIADCPFCGGSPKIIQRAHPAVEHVALAWIVQCSGCTAETCSEHRQWAIDYWNRRAPAVQATADAATREIAITATVGEIFNFTLQVDHLDLSWKNGVAAILRKAASLKDAADWQPIETAPKDGTSILVCGGIYWNDEGGAAIGDHEYPLGVEIACWYKDEWYLGYGEGYNDEKWAKPKYWMPKPAAVSGDKQEKERG